MTGPSKEAPARSFVASTLPWLIGGVGLLVYLATLNHWISFLNLGTVMRTSGWSWQPQLEEPLTSVVLFPFRFLPESWIPFALNLFTAITAALVLVLLARTVALLPQDTAPRDPFRKDRPAGVLSMPGAWMPPVLAATVCGFQLTFWEHATSASGTMINLFVFAWVIRSLLEFRVSLNPSWLFQSAAVFGAGMANDWAMVGLLPLFIAAVIRLKGFSFVNGRFLLRMTLWGLAGLSLYLLLPVIHSFGSPEPVGFWKALKVHLKAQWLNLHSLSQSTAFAILALSSLLSVLLLSVPWKSHTVGTGDDNRFGIFFTRWTGHFVHGLFFAIALWLALDPVGGPRRFGYSSPMLGYFYVSALVVGYCAGYFLLSRPARTRKPGIAVVTAAIAAFVVALPIALQWRNLNHVRTTNGPAMREFARQLYADLPAGRFVVLSEDPTPLFLVRSELNAHGRREDAVLLDTLSLFSPDYQAQLSRQLPSRWPVTLSTNWQDNVSRAGLMKLVAAFAAREPVIYLHPSSGLFFESFADEPNGLIHRLVPRPSQAIAIPLPGEPVVATNERIWQQRWSGSLNSLAQQIKDAPPAAPRQFRSLSDALRLGREPNLTLSTLGVAYSKALNSWGVQLQQLGRWPQAGVWFQRALDLNPENLAAQINREYNERHQRGDPARLNAVTMQHQFPQLFDRYNSWYEVLNADGPADEPTYLLMTGRSLIEGHHNHQAAATFARCADLAPDWLPPKLWLAESLVELGRCADALKLTDTLEGFNPPPTGPALSQLLKCRAKAMRDLGQTNEVTRCIEKFVRAHGEHREVLLAAANLYAGAGQYESELEVLGTMLKREPRSAELLAKQGLAELQLARYDAAIATLGQALTIDPTDDNARLYHAAACLAAGQLDAARRDYDVLLAKSVNSQEALFGLAAIAWRRNETNNAISYYERYLSNSVRDSMQYAIATKRLKELKGGAH